MRYRLTQGQETARLVGRGIAATAETFADIAVAGRERLTGESFGASERLGDRLGGAVDGTADYLGNLPVRVVDDLAEFTWEFKQARDTQDPERMGRVTAPMVVAGASIAAGAAAQPLRAALAEGRAPATMVEGADARPAAQFFDPAMIDQLDEAYLARVRGIDPDYGSGKGRRGTRETREHLDIVRDQFLDENPEYRHVAGGTNRLTGEQLPEEYLPGPGGGRRGSSFADLTFEAPDGSRIRINTVDADGFGVMTPREQTNFDRIFEQTGEPIIAVPKPGSIQRRRP
jgi:hypothetical protein